MTRVFWFLAQSLNPESSNIPQDIGNPYVLPGVIGSDENCA